MRERNSIPVTAAFIFILIVGLSASPMRTVYAADECVTKPNSPAPQGQHWYYRIDHANNRQCWRLGPEGLPVQKSGSSPATAAPPALPTRTREPATTGAAIAESQVTPDTNVTGPVSPVPWLGAPKFPELPPVLQPIPQATASQENRIVSALDTAPSSRNVAAASVSDGSLPATTRTEEAQHPMTVRRAFSPAPALASSEIDHTFAFLMIMFAMLAVAGPTLHYAERRRTRADHTHEPPRWAHVVTLNAPAPRVRGPLSKDRPKRPAPLPPTPPDRTERLAKALQQLVDQLQTPSSTETSTAARPVDLKMRRSAR